MEFTRATNAEGRSKIPPPPAEVGIRTMASDLEALRETGGGQPQFVNTAMQETEQKMNWGPILWIAGAIIFFLVGYYIIFPLFG